MQMSQDQAGYRYYPGMSQDEANEIEQLQFDQARHASLRHQWEVPPTPGRDWFIDDDDASSSHPPPLDVGASSSHPPPVDPPRRSTRARADPSRFSHSQYPDHIVHSQRDQ